MKKLSIIVPIYNMEKYIDRCVQSVLDAKLNDSIEILLINDGSKDKSQEIMDSYYKQHPDIIRVFNKENGGHGSVINFGIDKSEGKYLKILDSDDYFNTENLKKLIAFLDKNEEVDLIITSYYKVFENSCLKQKLNIKSNEIMPLESLYSIFSGNSNKENINYVPMAMVTYKTKVLKNCKKRLLEKTYYVDTEFNVFYINEVNDFIYLDLPIYNYCIGRADQSISSQSFVNNYNDHSKVVHSIIEYYNTHLFKTKIHKLVTEIMIVRLLNTQYAIYGYHLKKGYNSQLQKVMLDFDQWLKQESPYLYDKMAIRKYISLGRKHNFNKRIYRPFFFKLAIAWEMMRGTWKKYNI
ncbi:hypothetical protein AZF37_01080 [endosymbiont 'TC1' of Trimyema compressum]|uniref:glycosyltransferase family 2 protein n=1 Tax=endosymbiont 'TC1' of Trimyema compressum TaxID=243899 RepID=UPI0007F06AA1|nr:glycosyltransferase family 2 protein [endosymbiont 'TC1' of Trimyema compressum]AMP19962.1 hypothetical protein AZF37_01080 [endosymbiont 'TC1' of Trimyema compressum]